MQENPRSMKTKTMASNALPTKRDRLFALGDDLCDAAHDHEVAIGLKQNTESIVRPVLDAARTAESAFGQSQILRKAAKAARDAAEANLRNRLRGLITELETILAPEDPLWHAFGLSRPVDEETPEAPTFTTALASVAGTVLVDWDDALRAERYRVWIQVADVDIDFRAIETVYDSDATLSGLTRGVTVKIRVTSVNEAGESLPGPVAEAVVA